MGLLAQKKSTPESADILKADIAIFAMMTFAATSIVVALSPFPMHVLSTITEHLSL